jgi:hypothetical protein
MIDLVRLNIVKNGLFEITKDPDNSDVLTNGKYESCGPGEPWNEGFALNPSFDVSDIEKGWLVIFQKFMYHGLQLLDADGNYLEKITIKADDNVLDTNSSVPYYKRYLIKNNQISESARFCDQYMYYDAPWLRINPHSTSIKYELKFKTFFSWTNEFLEPHTYNKICSFEWFLNAEAQKKLDTWQMTISSRSSNEDVESSLLLGGSFDLDISKYRRLSEFL